ncbi:methyltransferase of 23S rRNA [Cyanobium sp. PCC 7001]|nr:methyltransferase of 23S rRNA [Cyanobium sp. PCC 7001]
MRFSPRFLQLLREAKSSGVLVEEVTWARLGQLTGGAVHQGIVLQTAAAETLDLPSLIEGCRGIGEPPLLMALDGITDPHNLGAIARSAEALGAHGLVLPQRRSAGLTGSVAKVAAGALEHLPVARVVNLNRALDSLKQEGYRVIGLASEGSVSLEQADLEGPLVIVTGSEADGLAMLTRKHCDQLVSIPLRGATPSLNASVATALLLYEVARRGWMKGLKGGQPAPRLQRPRMPVAAASEPGPVPSQAAQAGADRPEPAQPEAVDAEPLHHGAAQPEGHQLAGLDASVQASGHAERAVASATEAPPAAAPPAAAPPAAAAPATEAPAGEAAIPETPLPEPVSDAPAGQVPDAEPAPAPEDPWGATRAAALSFARDVQL